MGARHGDCGDGAAMLAGGDGYRPHCAPAASRGDAGWWNAVRRVRGAVRLYAGDGTGGNCVAKADACAVCGAGVSGGRVACAVCANRSDSRTLGSACGDTLSHDTDRAVLVWRRIPAAGVHRAGADAAGAADAVGRALDAADSARNRPSRRRSLRCCLGKSRWWSKFRQRMRR